MPILLVCEKAQGLRIVYCGNGLIQRFYSEAHNNVPLFLCTQRLSVEAAARKDTFFAGVQRQGVRYKKRALLNQKTGGLIFGR